MDEWERFKRRRRAQILAATLAVLGVVASGVALLIRAPANPPPTPGAEVHGALVVYSPGYRVSLFGIERLHPFDIAKMDSIARSLKREGLIEDEHFAVGEEVDTARLQQVHDAGYIAGLQDPEALGRALELNVPDFLSAEVLDARVLAPFRRQVGGTVVAARHARDGGIGIHLGGGFHHARPDMGHGFCVFNDVAVAIATLRDEGFDGRVLIVDTDAHQGDGNHAFFAEDPSVFSFSMHQSNLFPNPKLKGDADHGLDAGTSDARFLEALEGELEAHLDAFQPELVIHVAGSDVLDDDPLANMAMTPDGLVERDLMVYRAARERDLGLVHLLAGGYGPSSAKAQAASVAAMLREQP